MKFAVSTILLAAGLSAVMAQEPSSSSAAPSSSSASQEPSSSQGGAGGGAGGATSTPVATCTVLAGDPKVQPIGCPEGATTSTPPYNSESLKSYLIGGYSAGKEGKEISEVASELADTVTEYYPTITESYSAIVSDYANSLHSLAFPNGAPSFKVPAGVAPFAAAAVVAVAGGAFAL